MTDGTGSLDPADGRNAPDLTSVPAADNRAPMRVFEGRSVPVGVRHGIDAMKAWFQDDVLKRTLRNGGLIGAGKSVGGLLHLAALALSVALLGPYAFGVLMIVRSYAQAASGLAKFQSWQALIRYGAARADRGDASGLRDLSSFTVMLDGASGLLALAAAMLLAPALAPAMGVAPDAIRLAQLYCLVIPLMTSATPTGLLRLFDRFDWLSWQSVATPALRLGGIALAAALDAPLWGYVLAWLASDLIGELLLWFAAWRELKRRGLAHGPLPSARRAVGDNPGILRFTFAANLGATLNQAVAPLVTLLVGSLLGPAAAGLYRLLQILVDTISAPAEIVMRSLFPEAARLHERDPAHFRRLIGRMLALAALTGFAAGLIALVAGSALLSAAAGPVDGDLGPAVRILAIGFVPLLAAYPLETALLAIGAAGRLLAVRAAAAAAMFGSVVALAPGLGLAAVSAAISLGAAIAFVGLLLALLGVVPVRARSVPSPQT